MPMEAAACHVTGGRAARGVAILTGSSSALQVLDIQPEYVYADDSIEDTRTELERAGGAVAEGALETMLPVEEVTRAQTAASQPVATAAAPSVSTPPAAQRTQPPPGPDLASVPAESVQQANPQPKLAVPDEAELDTLLAGLLERLSSRPPTPATPQKSSSHSFAFIDPRTALMCKWCRWRVVGGGFHASCRCAL